MLPSRSAPAGETASVGMALGALAYALFSVHDASIKWLVASLPVWQILFFRSITIVVACLAIGRSRLLARAIETRLKGPLLLRGVLTLAAWLCYYSSARSLPLAQLLTLYFAAPIVVTILAVRLLGERVPPWRWVAVGIGFAGVLVASDPFGITLSLATGLVLFAAVLWAYGIIPMRQVARRESSLLQMFYGNVVFAVATGIATLVAWTSVGWGQLGLLCLVGVFGGLGQFCLFEAARRAPASVMASVEYSALIWAFLFGYLVWGDIPNRAVFLGAGLILSAGIILAVLEDRSVRRAPAA